MTYDKPQVRDFGDIAEHTYNIDSTDEFIGNSYVVDGDPQS